MEIDIISFEAQIFRETFEKIETFANVVKGVNFL